MDSRLPNERLIVNALNSVMCTCGETQLHKRHQIKQYTLPLLKHYFFSCSDHAVYALVSSVSEPAEFALDTCDTVSYICTATLAPSASNNYLQTNVPKVIACLLNNLIQLESPCLCIFHQHLLDLALESVNNKPHFREVAILTTLTEASSAP